MKRQRTIAAAPVRSASAAWQVVSTLLADTLERSPNVSAGSVTETLVPLAGLGPALIAGGHLESRGLVLADVGLHLTIVVKTADAALTVEENLNPVPGGTSATGNWLLHIPPSGPLNASIAAAVKKSLHLSTKPPPSSAPAIKASIAPSESPIDVGALLKMKEKP